MRAIITLFFLVITSSLSYASDSKDPYADYLPLLETMEEVNKIRSLRSSHDQRILDDRIILMGKDHLLIAKRKIRSGEFLKIERMTGSIYPSDIQLCDRHIGCIPFQFKIYKFDQPVKELRQQIKALNEALDTKE